MIGEARKILITGNTGRVGLVLAERLAKVSEVWGLSRYSRPGSLEQAIALGVNPVQADISRGELPPFPSDFDLVIHLAEATAPATAAEGLAANCEGVARVMQHCRKARAFLFLSSAFVYKPAADPAHAFMETDDIGSNYGGQYAPTKVTGEAAVRAGSIVYGIPAIICRANLIYGSGCGQGLIDGAIARLVAGEDIPVPPDGPMYVSPLYIDDIFDLLEPSFRLASNPPRVLNWGGDEVVEWRELLDFAGTLIGKSPRYVADPNLSGASRVQDPALRRSVAGPLPTGWQTGVRELLERICPQLLAKNT
ncbi:MAG TPA: NAD(P)-dependent oxidoreductase [Novosphingobium sp.]|nr:NAD(P)-dependent oxidoreductase [Novosphingobium sp.]